MHLQRGTSLKVTQVGRNGEMLQNAIYKSSVPEFESSMIISYNPLESYAFSGSYEPTKKIRQHLQLNVHLEREIETLTIILIIIH